MKKLAFKLGNREVWEIDGEKYENDRKIEYVKIVDCKLPVRVYLKLNIEGHAKLSPFKPYVPEEVLGEEYKTLAWKGIHSNFISLDQALLFGSVTLVEEYMFECSDGPVILPKGTKLHKLEFDKCCSPRVLWIGK